MEEKKTKTVSVCLPFEGIQNCREMAGIINKEGLITRPGLLYRSANLHHATQRDLLTLNNMQLEHVIDLRTSLEMDMEPDRLLQQWDCQHLPIFTELEIADKEGGQIELVRNALENPHHLFEQMYAMMILDPHSQAMWKAFFQTLLEGKGGILWHCTQGKDRTGIAAALVLSALDVDETLIREDYLQTNLYMNADALKDEKLARELFKEEAGLVDKDIEAFMYADIAYFDAASKAITTHYGSWKGYLQQALGLKDQDFARLKELYLEPAL